jgi:outer membrane protein assembly factor BamB
MKQLKGFIFTLDAVFALIVASVGVSILLYMHFTSPSLSQPQTTQVLSILQNLLETKIGAATGSQYALFASRTGSDMAGWPAFGGNGTLSSSAPYGPQALDLIYNFTASNTIVPIIAADDGVVAFGAGTELYALNATTGKLVQGFPVSTGSTFLGSPVIYRHTIIYANASGYLTAVSTLNGAKIWSSNIGVSIGTPIALEDGYLAFGSGFDFYLAYPSNGTILSSASLPEAAQVPAYANGEFIATTSSPGSTNYLLSYALNGNVLTRNWFVTLSTSPVSSPSVYNNLIFVGNGASLEAFTLGGTQKYSVTLNSQIYGSIAESRGNAYAETASNLYSDLYVFNISTGTTTSSLTNLDSENATPAVSSYDVYIMPSTASGSTFEAYDLASGRRIWNFTFPSSTYNKFASITLAYGNAYVVSGSTLYAFGTCGAEPNQSLISSIAGFYLNNEGGCATMILNSTYPSGNLGIFINNTFAPSLQTANFNGQNGYIGTSNIIVTSSNTITETAWVYMYPTTQAYSGIAYYGSQSTCGQTFAPYMQSTGLPGLSDWCSNFNPSGNGNFNNWNFVAFVQNGPNVALYYNNEQFTGVISTNTLNMPTGTGEPVDIGSGQFGAGQYFHGYIADIQLYNTSLSASQIQQLYQEGIGSAPISSAGLVGWWPLNGNANDYSGNNYVGIPHNINYINTGYLPQSLQSAYQVSKGTIPLSINSNGVNKIYNISAVLWR